MGHQAPMIAVCSPENDPVVDLAHGEEITVEGEAEPVVVKLGVWVSKTKTRRHKLTQEQLDALRELGVQWA
ncbi:helicase associated domain-containing protein [Streptomyces goshikiensis]|uniref:helicase associated domain-containing protein n=1 Tax=Streptomyces goshikiensis TaxID=1942 RepID=UPI00371BE5EC